MSRAQEHLAQANGHIAELKVQIVRQRVIVKYALDTGQPSEIAESMLRALEESLGAFEKHRIFLLSCSGSSSARPPGDAATSRSLSRRPFDRSRARFMTKTILVEAV
jgi:hypothetical protein